MIKQDANVNEDDGDGVTPLVAAVYSQNLELVDSIVRQGVNVNQDQNDGRTALILATGYGSVDIVNYLIQNGADVDQADLNSSAPLMTARGLEMVDLLIRAGADIDLEDHQGITALVVHAACCSADFVNRLIEACADVGHTAPHDITALSMVDVQPAWRSNHSDILATRHALTQLRYDLK